MANDIAASLSAFGFIFSFSFLVALTGAMVPGPLLTYTILKSAKSHGRGYLMGLWIIIGHALIEMGVVIFLLLGFSFVLTNVLVIRSLGIVGGLILLYFGLSIIRDAGRGTTQSDFLPLSNRSSKRDQNTASYFCQANQASLNLGEGALPLDRPIIENPVIGGMIISMSNPYWWVWWATIGFAFMVQFDVSLNQWSKLLAFFFGHEAGDLSWYALISVLSFFGVRHLSRKAYHRILIFCGIFMMGFGLYLAVMPFVK